MSLGSQFTCHSNSGLITHIKSFLLILRKDKMTLIQHVESKVMRCTLDLCILKDYGKNCI